MSAAPNTAQTEPAPPLRAEDGGPPARRTVPRPESGKAVLLLSTDLAETVGLCDRVLVVSSGRVIAELAGDELTEDKVTEASFAGVASEK